MATAMEIDGNELNQKPPLKRKREKGVLLTLNERQTHLNSLNVELNSLIKYFDELLSTRDELGFGVSGGNGNSVNAVIAGMLEERREGYGKIIGEICEKLKGRESGVGVGVASVKSSVLLIGQRVMYGVPKADGDGDGDVDVLEDETDKCLWCWETRDLKLLPSSLRPTIKLRRTCRKKIKERISVILDLISTLRKPEDQPIYKHEITKAMEKLNKVLGEADIRLLMQNLLQKNDAEVLGQDAVRQEATLKKELEKNMRELEKEKKRMDRELQKEKIQNEKEQKRLQQEAEKDEKRREKEELELRKQLKRKQEEVEREQRRREKEEAEMKKQRSMQKQASIMERFLKKSKTSATVHVDPSSNASTPDHSKSDSALESIVQLMDSALQRNDEVDLEEIRKCHKNTWCSLGNSIRSNRKQCWGRRHKPKTELIKELKLTSNKGPARDDMCIVNLVDEWEEPSADDKSCSANSGATSSGTCNSSRKRQLLQFDKSNRPAFYGIWQKKSCVVGPRHPLKKDPDLDYDIDSDEEWEEEDPGESLSDSEKEEEEMLGEGSLKADDEEESDDGFFVPDGYLSENEGVETDRCRGDLEEEGSNTPSSCKSEAESEEYSAWIRQQKYLHKLTEHALKKNQPLIIINLMHEKGHLSSDDLSGTLKVEQMCLQALAMRAFPGAVSIEIPSDNNMDEENHEACTPNGRSSAAATSSAIPDSDLPKIVSTIQSCSQGMSRVLESLQQSFPDIPKSHMRNKVREISDFVDNHWKVKKEVLDKLGMTISPEKTGGRGKSIATFFSKRCLPPTGSVVDPCNSSPESLKPGSSSQQRQQECTENM